MTDWLSLCRDRPCAECGVNDGTVVPAHANEQHLGKGMGLKAADWTVVPLCMAHHDWLDRSKATREEKRAAWRRWWFIHMTALLRAGLIRPVDSVPRVTARRVKPPARTVSSLSSSKVLEHSGEMRR